MRDGRNGWMEKLKNRLEKTGRRDGVSMGIVVCIGALLIAFSLAMAYTGSLMMANANSRLDHERAYQLAKSFAQVLDEEIAKGGQVTVGANAYSTDQVDETSSGSGIYILKEENSSSFYKFVKRFVGSSYYKDYDSADTENTVYSLQLESSGLSSDLTDKCGDVEIEIYKTAVDTSSDTSDSSDTPQENTTYTTYGYVLNKTGTTGNESYGNTIANLESAIQERYTLTVAVIATYGDSEYRYETEYYCKERLKLKCVYVNDARKTVRITWSGGTWVEGDSANGSPITLPEGTSIYYTYRTGTDGTISCTFENSQPNQ